MFARIYDDSSRISYTVAGRDFLIYVGISDNESEHTVIVQFGLR